MPSAYLYVLYLYSTVGRNYVWMDEEANMYNRTKYTW